MKTFATLALALVGLLSARADVKLNRLFSDHMVLQQTTAVPIWGVAAPGETVTVTLAGQTQTATAGPDGKWLVRFTDLKPGGPLEMEVRGHNTLLIRDILVGEVWLASGQSNMQMPVASTPEAPWAGVIADESEIAAARWPQIRMFNVKLGLASTPQTDVTGEWKTATPENVGNFSAVAYFFARQLHRQQQVPVGILNSSYGGSSAEAWIPMEALEARPHLRFLVDKYRAALENFTTNTVAKTKYQAALAKWQAAAAKAQAAGQPAPRRLPNPDPAQDNHNPAQIYNSMIAPLVPYAIRGAIWYQGESNGNTAGQYPEIMETLITRWRALWGAGDFPFFFTQLANYQAPAVEPAAGGSFARVRDAQLRTLAVTNTGMAVTIDIGDAGNIHPKNKQEVGRRLALIATAKVYGGTNEFSGPLYTDMTIDANVIRLRFTHTTGGLTAAGGKPVGFAIAAEDRKFLWADARIEGNTVVVSNAQIALPAAVRYGWADNPPVNLYNKAGLPASPFRTDDW